jgi:hypothetical protein
VLLTDRLERIAGQYHGALEARDANLVIPEVALA